MWKKTNEPGVPMSGRVLLAGFAPAVRERHAVILGEAGWQVLEGTGHQSVRVLGQSGTLAAILVPRGKRGQEAIQWLEDMVPEVPRISLTRGHDPLSLLTDLTALSPADERTWVTPEEASNTDSEVAISEVVAAPAPPLPVPAASHLGREDLEKKLAHIRFGNYFEALEVSADASDYVLRQQYQHLAALYCPAGWPGRLLPQEVGLLDEIACGLRDAYMVLGEPSTRERYGRALNSGRKHRR
jgi:hypothetical protein